MKKVFIGLLFIVATLSFTSCTDLTGNDETILETQATDKDCASNPGSAACLCPDPTDPTCN